MNHLIAERMYLVIVSFPSHVGKKLNAQNKKCNEAKPNLIPATFPFRLFCFRISSTVTSTAAQCEQVSNKSKLYSASYNALFFFLFLRLGRWL